MTETISKQKVSAGSSVLAFVEKFGLLIESFVGRYSLVLLALWSLVYFAATCYRASRKLFWFDELYTLFISALPHFSNIWYIETHGVDYNPPLFYLMTSASQAVFGRGELGTRMPEIIAFWIFCLCLYRFVSVRTTALTGLIAMSLPVVTTAYFYAYEARPHGIVLGLAGLAFASWQIAADRTTHRAMPLLVLGLSLACALLNHGYAVVLFVPLALGEFVRFIKLKRADLLMWLTLAISGSAILVTVPLLRSATSSLLPNFFRPKVTVLFHTYEWLFAPATLVICSAVCLLAWFGLRVEVPQGELRRGFRPWELTAVVGTLLAPETVFVVAYVTKAPYFERYALSAVAGLACLTAIALYRKPIAALLCWLTILGISAEQLREFRQSSYMSEPTTGFRIYTQRSEIQDLYKWLESDPHRELPIVLLDELEFAPLLYYAPPELKSRLVYRPTKKFQNGSGWRVLQECCNAPGLVLNDRNSNLPSPARFLAYETPESVYWVADFKNEGAEVSIDKISNNDSLLLVDYGASPHSPATATPR